MNKLLRVLGLSMVDVVARQAWDLAAQALSRRPFLPCYRLNSYGSIRAFRLLFRRLVSHRPRTFGLSRRTGRAKSRLRRVRSRHRGSGGFLRYSGYFLLYGVLVAGLAFLVLKGYRTLLSHPDLSVRHVVITGASPNTKEAVLDSLSWVKGRNIVDLELPEVRDAVRSNAWVAEARVGKKLFDTLEIVVTEKDPVGLIRLGNRIFVLSRDGRPVGPYDTYAGILDYPVIIGAEQRTDQQTAVLSALEALSTIRDTSLLFWGLIETIDVSDAENLKAQLRNVEAPVHLGERVIVENLTNYLAIAETIQNEYASLAYIELGFPNQVAVKPRGR